MRRERSTHLLGCSTTSAYFCSVQRWSLERDCEWQSRSLFLPLLIPTVSHDIISLVASSCGYYKGQIEHGTGSVSCNSAFVLHLCRFLNQEDLMECEAMVQNP
jgi:hypothetical protein